jgi:hypothetical protein
MDFKTLIPADDILSKELKMYLAEQNPLKRLCVKVTELSRFLRQKQDWQSFRIFVSRRW